MYVVGKYSYYAALARWSLDLLNMQVLLDRRCRTGTRRAESEPTGHCNSHEHKYGYDQTPEVAGGRLEGHGLNLSFAPRLHLCCRHKINRSRARRRRSRQLRKPEPPAQCSSL